MRQEPEILVPLSEVRQQQEVASGLPRWAVILTRLWIVLGVLATGFAFVVGSEGGKLGWSAAIWTFAFFAISWNVVAWIFGQPRDGQ